MIPILCSIDPFFESLYDTFVVSTYLKHSLGDSFTLHTNKITKYNPGPYGFCTLSYSIYRQQHIRYLLSFLESYPEQQYIISMDVDIIFLSGFKQYITNIILQNSTSRIFLSKDSDTQHLLPNIGMMVLQNCVQTRDFLTWLIYYIGTSGSPCNHFYQNMAKYLNHNKQYAISLLDHNKIIHNNSSENILRGRLLSREACCFHATSTSNIYSKSFVLSQAMCFLEKQGL